MTTAPAQVQSLATVSAQQKVVLSYFHDVLDGRRFGLVDQLFDADCVIHRPEGTVNGVANMRAFLERGLATFAKFETEVHDLVESGDRVVVQITHRALGAGVFRSRLGDYNLKGKSVTWDAIAILRLTNGKIAEEWVSLDELGILLSAGVLKANSVRRKQSNQ